MENLLEVRNLSTTFKTERGIAHAVRFVNFSIKPGETMGLVGESGSGKSVTAKSIMRLIDPVRGQVSGEIILGGRNVLNLKEKEMEHIRGNVVSMIFQDPMTSLNPLIPVGEQIAEMFRFHKQMSKQAARQATLELLRHIAIPSPEKRYSQYPHEFSGGMLQRLMIAIALSCKPQLLIADEPTTALDVTIQAQILRLMKNLQKEFGMAILMITHDLGVVAEVCDKISVMYAGEIVESSDVETIFASPSHPYTLGLMGSIPKLGANEKKLRSIEGAPPDLSLAIKGCAFAERCPFRTATCLEKKPQLQEVKAGHFVSCHHWNELEKEASA
ncbi:ABC transporter ATP-binding protein [Brevibacillus sp. H7]|uniref:ABC transporter ATP-binding protein n=1 Tax=Brevibacillus sp. H7 TaxID=3349138 RepID=UPI00380305CE